jgi:hypothetical protein
MKMKPIKRKLFWAAVSNISIRWKKIRLPWLKSVSFTFNCKFGIAFMNTIKVVFC